MNPGPGIAPASRASGTGKSRLSPGYASESRPTSTMITTAVTGKGRGNVTRVSALGFFHRSARRDGFNGDRRGVSFFRPSSWCTRPYVAGGLLYVAVTLALYFSVTLLMTEQYAVSRELVVVREVQTDAQIWGRSITNFVNVLDALENSVRATENTTAFDSFVGFQHFSEAASSVENLVNGELGFQFYRTVYHSERADFQQATMDALNVSPAVAEFKRLAPNSTIFTAPPANNYTIIHYRYPLLPRLQNMDSTSLPPVKDAMMKAELMRVPVISQSFVLAQDNLAVSTFGALALRRVAFAEPQGWVAVPYRYRDVFYESMSVGSATGRIISLYHLDVLGNPKWVAGLTGSSPPEFEMDASGVAFSGSEILASLQSPETLTLRKSDGTLAHTAIVRVGEMDFVVLEQSTPERMLSVIPSPTPPFVAILCFGALGLCFLILALYTSALNAEIRERAEREAHAKIVAYVCHEMRNPLHALGFLSEDVLHSVLGGSMWDSKIAKRKKQKKGIRTFDSARSNDTHFDDDDARPQNDGDVEDEDFDSDSDGDSDEAVEKQRQRLDARAAVAENLELVVGIVNHMVDMVNGFLDFAKISTTDVVLEARVTDVTAVARDAFFQARVLAPKGMELEFSVALSVSELCMAVDPVRLRQIFANGLSNALKYTHSKHGKISFHIRRSGEDVSFVVTDNGPGLGEDQTYLYEDYQQGNANLGESHYDTELSVAKRIASTGLGLGICRYLVTLMGGKMSVSNRTDGICGTVFQVDLPYVPVARLKTMKIEKGSNLATSNDAEESGDRSCASSCDDRTHLYDEDHIHDDLVAHLAKTTSRFSEDGGSGNLELRGSGSLSRVRSRRDEEGYSVSFLYKALKRRVEIVCVEDDAVNSLILLKMFRQLGFTDDVANLVFLTDGEDVLPHLESVETDVDLLLMDVIMKRQNGDVTCALLRDHPLYSSIPAVAMTGIVREDELRRFSSVGYVGMLTKPFNVEQLKAVIFTHVDTGIKRFDRT